MSNPVIIMPREYTEKLCPQFRRAQRHRDTSTAASQNAVVGKRTASLLCRGCYKFINTGTGKIFHFWLRWWRWDIQVLCVMAKASCWLLVDKGANELISTFQRFHKSWAARWHFSTVICWWYLPGCVQLFAPSVCACFFARCMNFPASLTHLSG